MVCTAETAAPSPDSYMKMDWTTYILSKAYTLALYSYMAAEWFYKCLWYLFTKDNFRLKIKCVITCIRENTHTAVYEDIIILLWKIIQKYYGNTRYMLY